MKHNLTIDWKHIEYTAINEEKALHIYTEGLAYLTEIASKIKELRERSNKLLNLILPIALAITGTLIIRLQTQTFDILFYISIITIGILYAILIMLLLGLRTSAGQFTHAQPYQYFTQQYYHQSLHRIYIGNIKNIHKKIQHNTKILHTINKVVNRTIFIITSTPILLLVITVMYKLIHQE